MERRTILCIEDEEDIRTLYRLVLARAGYAFQCAATGQEGLALARALHPRLIILDLMMPDMNGLEVLDAMGMFPDLRETPILIVTVRDLEAERIVYQLRHEQVNVVGYLLKPFPLRRLIEMIERALQES